MRVQVPRQDEEAFAEMVSLMTSYTFKDLSKSEADIFARFLQ